MATYRVRVMDDSTVARWRGEIANAAGDIIGWAYADSLWGLRWAARRRAREWEKGQRDNDFEVTV